MKGFVYERKKIIIGSSFESLLYAYKTGTPIMLIEAVTPFEFDIAKEDFSFLGFNKKVKYISVWNRMHIIMSMAGLLLNPFETKSWRTEENSLIFITPQNKKIIIKCEECVSFDKKTDKYDVYDWFDTHSGGKHDLDFLENEGDEFISKILFFPSKRAQINNIKDVVSVSKLTEEQVTSINYSEGIARLKTLDTMKKAGMRGTKNGFNKRGIQLHYALKIEHSYREVKQVFDPMYTIKHILENVELKEEMCKLTKDLFTPRTAST